MEMRGSGSSPSYERRETLETGEECSGGGWAERSWENTLKRGC